MIHNPQDISQKHPKKAETIDGFLSIVSQQIQYKKIRPELLEELQTHMNDITCELTTNGTPAEEAEIQAVRRMGDPAEIGYNLNKTHKPIIEWSLLVLIGLLTAVGLFVLYQLSKESPVPNFNFTQQIFSTVLGIIVLVVMMFFDYTAVKKYSFVGYGLASFALYFITSSATGNPHIFLTGGRANVYIIIPFLILFFCGITMKLCTGKTKDFLILLGLAGIPLLFLLMISLTTTLLLGVAFLSIITYAIFQDEFQPYRKKTLLFLGGIAAAGTLLLGRMVFFDSARIQAWLNPLSDPLGRGYLNYLIYEYLATAKLTGTSLLTDFGSRLPHELLPNAHNDYSFISILANYGWLFAGLVLSLLTAFLIRVILSAHKVRDSFGRMLSIGICTAIAFQIILHVLVNIGAVPSTSVSLPFISYGGSGFFCNMALTGLLLGIYRRKNILCHS